MNPHYLSLAHDHWKKYRPTYYRELVQNGTLQQELETAALATEREIRAALDARIPRDQAWESIKGRYLLVTPESDRDDLYGDNPNQAFYNLVCEVHEATQELYESDLSSNEKQSEEFTGEELERIRQFHNRRPLVRQVFLDSLNETALEHDKPRHLRKKPC